ncbi:hypothetical protein LCGC14_0258170 [marine sediment metagenome]|uniref:Uncharacterized protein n=1 Tax=marine sediment metagenome TaxID=412755 RepID=A0A0F9X730_9ZZZZ
MAYDAPKNPDPVEWKGNLDTLKGIAAFARDRAKRAECGVASGWISMQLLQLEHRILACDEALTGLIGRKVLDVIFDQARIAYEISQERNAAREQLAVHGRAFKLILERVQRLAEETNERDSLNTAVIIEHIIEATDGDEGAIASIRVLGIEWPES